MIKYLNFLFLSAFVSSILIDFFRIDFKYFSNLEILIYFNVLFFTTLILMIVFRYISTKKYFEYLFIASTVLVNSFFPIVIYNQIANNENYFLFAIELLISNFLLVGHIRKKERKFNYFY